MWPRIYLSQHDYQSQRIDYEYQRCLLYLKTKRGLNQTVLFALAMLIIAVLVGARGLAEQVNIGLRDADTGLGMTAGLSMAFIAIIADRILRGYANSLGSTDIGD